MSEYLLQQILTGQRPAVTYTHDIIGLERNAVEAREILTRFQDDDGRMKTVGKLLEDVTLPPQLKVKLDLLCLRAVFEALARTPITDHLIFVNLDPASLDSLEFWNHIEPWMWHLSIPPHCLVLEITEAYSSHEIDRLEGYAKKLRDIGFRLAVDDLGSGVASLAHMARLAPDFIKVDRSLVRHVHRRPYQAALLNALSHFARHMNVGYIAEGIETPEELQAVMDAGVPWGQGFIFGEPQPTDFSEGPSRILD